MYKISVKSNFAAAHKLIGYQGSCERIHGHNWTVKAQIIAKELDSIGIGCDFKDLKKLVDDIIERFDHQLLNDVPPFNEINPTSENLAKYIFQSLKELLPPLIQLSFVEVNESEKYSIIYSED